MIHLQSILDAGVQAGAAPGFSAGVITRDGERLLACAGVRGAGSPQPMTQDTLFWMASCTKVITSVAALQLVERGLIDLDAPVGERLPTLSAPKVLIGFDAAGVPQTRAATRPITLRRLLTHTSGLAYDFFSEDLSKFLAATGGSTMSGGDPDIPLMFEPGDGWQYGVGVDWTGRLIEAVTGAGLDAWCAEHIFAPLGMTDTTFFPSAEQATRKVSMHRHGENGGFIETPFGMPSVNHFMMGGGGLYSTASDFLRFLGAILHGGAPLLRPETFALVMSNQVGELDAGALKSAQPLMSLDFEPLAGLARRHSLAGLINMEPVPHGRSTGSLAWAGIANCYYWADPTAGFAGVILAQVMPFVDPGILATFGEMERAVYA